MTTRLNGGETLHMLNGAGFVAETIIDLTPATIDQFAGTLVLAETHENGQPTRISGPAYGHDGPGSSDGNFYVPPTLGKLGKKHSDTHFVVHPLSTEKPPRLFAYSGAVVMTAVEIDS